jgi:hypothetical protein
MRSRGQVAALVASLGAAVLMAAVAVACGGAGSAAAPPPATPATGFAGQLVTDRFAGATRTVKTRLIEQLTSPPQVVIFGGSRVMRFDPAYIRRRTGLSGFNAAVTQARPEDTWALLNLLHTRFPTARFRFLWVIHCDEFDPRPIHLATLMNPALAPYFPPSLVRSQLARTQASAKGLLRRAMIGIPNRGKLVYAPDGYVISGFFSNTTPPPNGHPGSVHANIMTELKIYRSTPAALYPRSVRYLAKDLRLMDSLSAASPVLVAAPFDHRIYAATVHHGWRARYRRLLALLARLRARERFSFLDLSRARAHGFKPSDFYDGIHLTPQGAQRVIDLVLKRFPTAL